MTMYIIRFTVDSDAPDPDALTDLILSGKFDLNQAVQDAQPAGNFNLQVGMSTTPLI